jgi:trehalose-6-phosphate synthase
MADVFVLSSLRDGLNLTPHEFTVCQVGKDDPGAMVISEFAGISQSLAGTIRVNPWDFGELVESLNSALTMDVEERRERFRSNYSYVKSATAVSWANTFLSELKKVRFR